MGKAFDLVGERLGGSCCVPDKWFVEGLHVPTEFRGLACGAGESDAIRPDDRMRSLLGFGTFRFDRFRDSTLETTVQQLPDRCGEPLFESISADDPPGVCKRCRVGRRRAGADDRGIVADDVGD